MCGSCGIKPDWADARAHKQTFFFWNAPRPACANKRARQRAKVKAEAGPRYPDTYQATPAYVGAHSVSFRAPAWSASRSHVRQTYPTTQSPHNMQGPDRSGAVPTRLPSCACSLRPPATPAASRSVRLALFASCFCLRTVLSDAPACRGRRYRRALTDLVLTRKHRRA